MAASTNQTDAPISLKLLVNKETNKVLFAEAGKEFVDILCNFLTFPLATIARLVQKKSSMGSVTIGCLNSLYQSVENLDEKCLQKVTSKQVLLRPPESYCGMTLKLNIDDAEPKKYFICAKAEICTYLRLSIREKERCPCGNLMTRPVFIKHFCQGFVKDDVSFVITDDLTVMPNSIQHSSFGLLQSLRVQSTGSIKEMTVNVTKEKVVDLLKCSLLSKSTLTDLFLLKKPSLEMSSFSPCRIQYGINIQINLKLVVRKSDGKILYAQGEEDFGDSLLSFLTFPLGAVLRVLGGESCVGSLDGLYRSISNLNEKYLMSTEAKNKLINPRLASYLKSMNQLLPTYNPAYRCYYQRGSFKESWTHDELYITEHLQGTGGHLQMSLVSPGFSAGYVKGAATYIATDDLVVTPVSPISAVSFISRLGTSLCDLEEKAVTIGVKEYLSILKASLTSTSALTNGLRHLFPKIKEEK